MKKCSALIVSTLFIVCLGAYGQTDTLPSPIDSSRIPIDSLHSQVDSIHIQVDSSQIMNNKVPEPGSARKGPVYKLHAPSDIPIAAVAAAWSLYGFSKIYNKDPSTVAKINSLKKSDINDFDRWAADIYSEKFANSSDFIFYASMPLPFFLFVDKNIRKDFLKISFLYFETMSITGIFYTGSNHIFDRYRPLAYNAEAPMDVRTGGGAKNSFIAGHPALVATSTFFMAKVISDYYPDSKIKWVFYGIAAAATGSTAYLRHRGGRHFPSDLIVGVSIGILDGILVPHWHKNKLFKNKNLSVFPFTGQSHGVALNYRL